jgi:hypothetical protein
LHYKHAIIVTCNQQLPSVVLSSLLLAGKGPWLMDEGQRQEYFSGAYGRQSVGYQPLMSGEQRTAGAPQGSGMGGMA